MKVSELKNNPNNPRKIEPAKLEKLVESIRHFPEMMEKRPMVCVTDVDGKLYPLGGNQRLKAIKQLGEKEIPDTWVMLADDWTVEQRNEFLVKDNVSVGEWDFDMLKADWDVDLLEEWGVEIPNWDEPEVLEAEEDDFDVPEGGIETDIVLGDLFEIGEHRLLCGDSTDSDQVAKLMNGEKADMVFTDPPYGVEIVSKSSSKVGGGGETKFKGQVGGSNFVEAKVYDSIIGDDTTETAKEFYHTCISLGMENFIIWGGNYFTDFLPPSMCWIVWDKENTGNFADVELAWTSFNKGAKLYKWLWNGMSRKGERAIEGKTRVHPTQKPVGLFNDIFRDFEFKTCFDGFGGSGSTMAACHQVKKKCFMIEMSPNYIQVIVDRMRKLDPTIEIKKNGQKYSPQS